MSPTMRNLLFKKRREALDQLKGLVEGVGDIDAASFFNPLDDGFQDGGACASGLLIKLPGPRERETERRLTAVPGG